MTGRAEDDDVILSNGSIHDAIRVQVMEILEDSDMSEEEKQAILVALSCPCCGAAGLSMSIPLKRSRNPGF